MKVAVSHIPVTSPDHATADERQDLGWFRAFYQTHHSAVRAVVYRFGILNDLDDVVQEVFIKAFRAAKNFRHAASDRTWILRIAINAAKDYARRNRNTLLASPKEDSVGSASAEDNINLQTIDLAIRQLSETLREAFILNVLEGYTLKETAEILNIPEGTAKSRINAARDQLRGFLAKHGVTP